MRQATILSVSAGILLTGLAVTQAQAIDVVGKGTVAVLNGTNFDDFGPDDKIGCLNVYGALTLEDCAEFTIIEPPEYDGLLRLMSTEVGLCSFQNPTQPTNVDSIYGKNDHAWSCYQSHPENEIQDAVYTINGFKQPFICHGDTNCYYDTKRAPATVTDALPVWTYAWGSQQLGITPGHIQVVWLWEPINSS